MKPNKRGEDRESTRKRIQKNDSEDDKMIQNLENKTELQISRLEARIEKI